MMEVKRATVNLQGSARLEEIRASLAAEKSGTSAVGFGTRDPGHRGQRRRIGRHIRRPVYGRHQGPRHGWLSARSPRPVATRRHRSAAPGSTLGLASASRRPTLDRGGGRPAIA